MTALDTLMSTQGAIGWWPMQETSGLTVIAGIGSNGTYQTYHQTGCGPRSNLPIAAAINNTDIGNAAVPLDLSGTDKASVSWWMLNTVWDNSLQIAVEHTPNYNFNKGFISYWNDGALLDETGMSAGDSSHYRTGRHITRPTVDTWHHWAATYDRAASTYSLWLDGSAVTLTPYQTATMSGNFLNSTLYIGARSGGVGLLRGKMCGVAAFDRILSGSEINDQIAAAGTVRFPGDCLPPAAGFRNLGLTRGARSVT